MHTELSKPPPESAAPELAWAHPLVRDWFVARFGTPTEPQLQGWPRILAGETTLISAPTGSGKTLAAFLVCIDRLVRKAIAGELADRTEVLYVSPLKALGNDIQKNLEMPLARNHRAGRRARNSVCRTIRTAVRTGDTPAHERQQMLVTPPHILVTTPESLYILLTAAKSREILKTRAHRDRGRNSRRRGRQARRAPGAFAGAAGAPRRSASRANRPLRHAEADRACRAFPRGQRTA